METLKNANSAGAKKEAPRHRDSVPQCLSASVPQCLSASVPQGAAPQCLSASVPQGAAPKRHNRGAIARCRLSTSPLFA